MKGEMGEFNPEMDRGGVFPESDIWKGSSGGDWFWEKPLLLPISPIVAPASSVAVYCQQFAAMKQKVTAFFCVFVGFSIKKKSYISQIIKVLTYNSSG